MTFHKEGRVSIAIAFILAAILVIIALYPLRDIPIIPWILEAGALFILVATLQFFRNPQRPFVEDEDLLVAPADGKVVVIEDTVDDEYFKGPVKQISIFMSPTNVHINWYPISGKVVYSKYHSGKYLVAWDPKSSTDNERHSVVIHHAKYGDILVKQIAGAVARRIVNYAKIGDQVAQGEELGFIKFGSRVDVLIPVDTKVDVELDQKSHGGQTILAKLG